MYEREVSDAKALLTGRVDGLLACVSKETRDFEHFKEFEERAIPLVFFDCAGPINTDKVVIDDFDAAHAATKHLAEQGCRHIGYVGGPISLQINQDRFAGYKKALEEHGLSTDERYITHCITGDFEEGIDNTKGWFMQQSIDGLFAGTDMLAIGAMKNIKKAGLKIPEEVAVVGFSNWFVSKLYEPALTTVNQPGYEMGYKAAELVIDQIEKPQTRKFETVVLKTELVLRQSSNKSLKVIDEP